MSLLLGVALGALLFGGRSSTTIVERRSAKEVPGGNVTPQIIFINKKTHEVLATCSECGGAGEKEYSYTSFSSSIESENGTKIFRGKCKTCQGKKLLVFKVEDKIWEKAKRMKVKRLAHTAK